jgi:eukaryotic-like serine/threonine-protein kinase
MENSTSKYLPPHVVDSDVNEVIPPSPQQAHALLQQAHALLVDSQNDGRGVMSQLLADQPGIRSAPDRSALPRTLFGYDVLEFLGEGAGSSIYAVSDPATNQIYALKHVVRKDEKSERFSDQLENEYNVGIKANHPRLRKVIDLKINKTILWKLIDAALVMELFDGTPLDLCPQQSVPQLTTIFIEVAQALGALHAAGFVHCDLKPNNILVSADGDVKVIDLGQAAPINTKKERIQGTPDFIAPEQVKLQPVTTRTDIFNFGATMYWALCNKKLPTLYTVRKGPNSFLVDARIESPEQANPSVPATLSNFVMECVRTAPEKRPASMTDVISRLEVIQHTLTRSR